MADSDEQINERYVLESMYESDPRLMFEDQGGEGGGMFMASPHVPEPFFIAMQSSDGETGSTTEGQIEVKHLPPITLNFVFPWDYPSAQAPVFTLTCDWLSRPQLSRLCQRLDGIWEENRENVILYTWFQFLETEAFDFLDVTSPLNLSTVISHLKGRHRKKSHQFNTQLTSSTDVNSLKSEHNTSVSEQSAPHPGPDSAESGCSYSQSHADKCECDSAYSSQTSNTNATCKTEKEEGEKTHLEDGCDPRAKQDVVSVAGLMQKLIEYDKQKQQEEFDRSTVTCVVCFMDVPGFKCVKFVECGHAFCRHCVEGSFRVKIKDGDVKGLTCLMPKCETQAYPYQVKAVVTPEEYDRYDKILLRVTLETMSDVVYCPRRICQSAVIRESSSNMGRCPQCSFVFCTLCKLSYHGPTPCRVKSEELQKLCREYIRANAEKKQFMEKQYGKRTIQRALEEMDSAQWLEQNAKMCPYCGTQIQKKDGCNKMTCTKCRTYFCWLCNEMLSRSNPYGHYSNPGSPCSAKLFEGTEIQNDDDDWWDEEDGEEGGYLIF